MEEPKNLTCQSCFRPFAEAGAKPLTQWVTVCRCDRPFLPKSQFSIEVCSICKQRLAAHAIKAVRIPGLCGCANPSPVKVPAYISQHTNDAVGVDLTPLGLTANNFPLERFTPISILKNGPKGTTILARDRQRGAKVVVKCFKNLPPALQSTFESELKKNQKLTHANIAKTVMFGSYNNVIPYAVTEYKDGFNLEQCVALYGVPSYDVAVKILMGVCEILMSAQKESMLHRALRPSNVLFVDDLNSEPTVLVTDFALAKLKLDEQLREPQDAMWLSADLARGLEYSEKSEVYNIGCLGYLLLAGRPPYQGGTALELKNLHALKLPPRISDVNFDAKRPKDLDEVIEKCLEKDPKDRFESAAKLLERLEVFPRREQMRIAAILAERNRKKMLAIAGGVIGLIVVCAVAFALMAHH